MEGLKLGAAFIGLTLATLLILAPVEVVLDRASGAPVPPDQLDIVQGEQGECPKGVFVRLLLQDGSVLALGENHRAVKIEQDKDDPAGMPVVTFGAWDERGLDLHAKTRHKAPEGASLCADLFPGDA